MENTPVTLPNKNWNFQEMSGRTVYFRLDLNVFNKPTCTPEPHTCSAHVSATNTVTVFDNGSWTVHLYRNRVDRTKSNVLNSLPAIIYSSQVTALLSKLDKKGSICAGHPDNHFIEMIKAKKGKLLTVRGEISSYLDDNPVEMNGQQYRKLFAQLTVVGKKASTTSSHCNNRYLSTPEKNEKISKLQSTVYAKTKLLQEKIKKMIETRGEEIDTELHSDLSTIMHKHKTQVCPTLWTFARTEQKVSRDFQEGSFQWLLWSEQKKLQVLREFNGIRL